MGGPRGSDGDSRDGAARGSGVHRSSSQEAGAAEAQSEAEGRQLRDGGRRFFIFFINVTEQKRDYFYKQFFLS